MSSKIRGFFYLLTTFVVFTCFYYVFLLEPLQWKGYTLHLPTVHVKGAKNQHQTGMNLSSGPTREYEKTRVDLEHGLDKLTAAILNNNQSSQFGETLDFVRAQKSHLWKLPEQDGYQEFRIRERAELRRIVQQRIQDLQNPANCSTARKLACSVDNINGFGCLVHHIVFCLMTAYSTNRTLILSLAHNYKGPSWNQIFLPLSNNCLDSFGSSHGVWGGAWNESTAQVLSSTAFESMDRKQPAWNALGPSGVPLDIASRLERLSIDPVKWWVGQFSTYVLRPTHNVSKILNQAKMRMNRSPFKTTDATIISVGVHVRRTDKHKEAKPIPLDRYMKEVEEYLAVKEKKKGYPVKAQVFLATDEPKVIQEARMMERKSNNLKWKIWANESIARAVETLPFRFKNGILPILMDLMLLADCEFVVCTFTSNICTLVAELKEANADVGGKVVSLDYIYYYIPSWAFPNRKV